MTGRRITAALLALMMCASLCACGETAAESLDSGAADASSAQ